MTQDAHDAERLAKLAGVTLGKLTADAKAFVAAHWSEIDAVAKVLAVSGFLDGKHPPLRRLREAVQKT